MRLTTAIEGLAGIICIADDILVFGEGNNFEEAQEAHDKRLIAPNAATIERSSLMQANCSSRLKKSMTDR